VVRTLAHGTVEDLTALVGAIANGDQPGIVRLRASIMDDQTRLVPAVAADAGLSNAQRLVLDSEINVATQAMSFVSEVPVVTDQASIDRLRAVVVRVGSELDDHLPVDASCG
jgi:hypothetical protein